MAILKEQYYEGEHLNDAGLMLYAEAIQLGKVGELPDGFYQHIRQCRECDEGVMELTLFLKSNEINMDGEHPYFDRRSSDITIPDDPEELDQILQQIIAEATPVPHYERMIEKSLSYRSSTNVPLTVSSPHNGQLYAGIIPFTFDTKTHKPITLLLENNKMERVVKPVKLPAGTTEYKMEVSHLPTGLYYWKAGIGAKMLLTGKVYLYHPA